MSLLNADILIPHISNITTWNYHLSNNTYSSDYVGLYYTWKSVWVLFFLKRSMGGCLSYCLVFECHKAYKMPNELPNGM